MNHLKIYWAIFVCNTKWQNPLVAKVSPSQLKFNILVVFGGSITTVTPPPSLTSRFLTHELAAHLMSSAWEWWVELVLCFLLYKQNQNNFLYTTINIYKKKNHQKKHVLFVVNQTKKIQKSITPWEKNPKNNDEILY